MGTEVTNTKSKWLNKIPWTVLLIVYLLIAQFVGLDMSGIAGYIFLGLGVAVLFIEFIKSGDISAGYFIMDLTGAVLSVIVATALLTYMFMLGEMPTFFHWFGYAIIVGDAIITPFNSFRTALRNFGVGVGS